MRMREVKEILKGEVICGEEFLDIEVKMGCGSDLMSLVLSSITCDDVLLLTGLTTQQVVYICDAVNIKAVCFVGGKRPEDETIELARERKMILLVVEWPTYESCGKLYYAGLTGCSEYERQK